jgi:Na+/H+ antiporter NhaC
MIRLIGIALLLFSGGSSWLLGQMARDVPPGSPPTLLGLLVSLVIVATAIAGGNMVIVGPSLFRR